MGKQQGEKIVVPTDVSMSNEQWNVKCNKLESDLAIAHKKIDERDTALKNVANALMQAAMTSTDLSAGMNSMAKQIVQILQPPAPPQQTNLPPNNKAN